MTYKQTIEINQDTQNAYLIAKERLHDCPSMFGENNG